MAQIQEYTPQVAAQEPVGGVSPNIELAGAVGRSVERLGSTLLEGADLLHRRNAQSETADVYSNIADRRASVISQVNQQAQDGSLDQEAVLQDHDDWAAEQSGNYSTPEAKNYFERQSARLRATILQHSGTAMAQISSRNAQGVLQDGIDKDGLTLRQNPDLWKDIIEHQHEFVDEQIKNGLPANQREKWLQYSGAQLAQRAIEGFAERDPDLARAMLKTPDLGGRLNTQQYDEMVSKIKTIEHGQQMDAEDAPKKVDRAYKLSAEALGQDVLKKMNAGSFTSKDVMDAPGVRWEDKVKLLDTADRLAKRQTESNPRVMNQLYQKIANGDLSTYQDLAQYSGHGVNNPKDFSMLLGEINKNPDNVALQKSEKAMFAEAKRQIINKDWMGSGKTTMESENSLNQFTADYLHEKQKVRTAGGDVHDLLDPDPNNKNSFFSRMKNYRTDPMDSLKDQQQDRKDKALGNKPTGDDPNPTTVPGAKRPGESVSAWKTRTNYKGGR